MALKGTTTAEKIWNFLKGKGLSDCGTAGLMGNLYAESGLMANNLQNTYSTKFGMTDAQYTAAVDNGSYDNFVRDSAGYGLAQWTYWSRKEKLLEFAKKRKASIGDLEMQLEFLYEELSSSYKSVLNVLKTATSVRTASNEVLTKFERPANQGTAVQNARTKYGEKYLNEFAVEKGDTTMGFVPRLTKPEAGNKYYITKSAGGYSSAIKGSPTDKDCNVLHNCVGYAYGRFNEIGGYGCCKYLRPTNAENFMQYKGSLETGMTPKLGACMVWQKGATLNGSDGAGHVAIVEQIISDTEVVTSESGWGAEKPFWTQNRKKGNGNWGAGSGYKFLGFIYNPAVTGTVSGVKTETANSNTVSDNSANDYKVGDIVQFTGNKHFANANAAKSSACKPGKAKVTNKFNGKHPIHLIAVNGGGSNVYGWCDLADIQKISSANATVNSTSQSVEKVHTVKDKENLTVIAQMYGTTVEALVSYNGIKNANLIRVGQRIKIPPTTTASTSKPVSNPVTTTSASTSYKKGDKVIVNGTIYYTGKGTGRSFDKKNAVMYVCDIVSSKVYSHYIGVSYTKGGGRQGWVKPSDIRKA